MEILVIDYAVVKIACIWSDVLVIFLNVNLRVNENKLSDVRELCFHIYSYISIENINSKLTK